MSRTTVRVTLDAPQPLARILGWWSGGVGDLGDTATLRVLSTGKNGFELSSSFGVKLASPDDVPRLIRAVRQFWGSVPTIFAWCAPALVTAALLGCCGCSCDPVVKAQQIVIEEQDRLLSNPCPGDPRWENNRATAHADAARYLPPKPSPTPAPSPSPAAK